MYGIHIASYTLYVYGQATADIAQSMDSKGRKTSLIQISWGKCGKLLVVGSLSIWYDASSERSQSNACTLFIIIIIIQARIRQIGDSLYYSPYSQKIRIGSEISWKAANNNTQKNDYWSQNEPVAFCVYLPPANVLLYCVNIRIDSANHSHFAASANRRAEMLAGGRYGIRWAAREMDG